jgi:hypothetical protein
MKKLFLASLLLLVITPNIGVANEASIKNELSAKLSQLVELMKDPYAEEYEKARGIAILKMGNSENEEHTLVVAVAVFTIESFALGNNYTQFMAVFANLSEDSEGHPQRLSFLDVKAVGGKGIRGVEFNKIKLNLSKDGKILITVPTLEYGSKDPMCCPSIKSSIKYSIEPSVGGRLKEVKRGMS